VIIYTVEVTRGKPATIHLPQRLIPGSLPHHDIIITHIGTNQQEYILLIPELKEKTLYCSTCGSVTHFHQWKKRNAWSSDSPITKIPQLQVICTNASCKATHVIIPDFLCPYKRYVGAEIEAAIEPKCGEEETAKITAAEESTIRRWKNQFARRLEERLQVLVRVLMNEYEKMLSLLDNWQEIDRLRRVMQLFPGREAATTLGRANLELFWNSSGLYF
jgi:hypothetical protein